MEGQGSKAESGRREVREGRVVRPASLGPSLLPEDWRVDLPIFEGPLDLLLHLVKVNEVEISDIPVARVCEQFHAYLALMEELDLDIAAEYIYEAAMLIHLKSKLLLPAPKAEDGQAEDPRRELVDRLLEYRRIKEAAQTLAEIHSVRRFVWTRESRDLEQIRRSGPDPEIALEDLSFFDLLQAFRETLDRYRREHPPDVHVDREAFSVRDQLQRILREVTRQRAYDVLFDLRDRSCRAEAVAAFLAVLELLKLNLARLHQARDGSLLLYRTTTSIDEVDLDAVPT